MAEVKSTWDLLREAIKEGRKEEALKLLDKGTERAVTQADSLVSFVGMLATRLAALNGEDELGKIYRERYTVKVKDWLKVAPGAKESAERITEYMSSPGSRISITEEPGRWVVSLDPCRTGGRLIRSMATGTAKFDAASVGTTKKAHDWHWGKTGICYYCAHSALFFEVIPIELRGYPIAIIEYPPQPTDPCQFFFYKKPELIPEQYFTRLGKKKNIK